MRRHEASSNGHDHDQSAWDSVISRAVETGYKVIEDQIHQGRHFAQQFGATAFAPGPDDEHAGTDAGHAGSELMERLMHFYSDMGSLCFDMLESVARNPAFGDLMRSAMPAAAPAPGQAKAHATGPAAAPVSIEIVSATATGARCSVEWLRPPHDGALVVSELRALDPGCPALTQIEFQPADGQWLPLLRIAIPDGQAPGNYAGMAVDASTNVPCATILLEIPHPAADTGH